MSLTQLVALLLASGCETLDVTKRKTIEPEPAVIQKEVHVRDKVVIGTKDDGKKIRLRVTGVTSEAVVGTKTWKKAGEEIQIPFEQIETIQTAKLDPKQVALAVGFGILFFAALAFLPPFAGP
ncbi:MAG: hypothetical protein R3268_08545 [Acidiferrobacterales bacterium]|nr:hypothetical protein [Acidiferrobacterales bacterium]